MVIGINCNGLSGKRDSLTAILEILRPSVFLTQETTFMKKGLFKVKDYEIFESIRKTGGGSILTGVHCNLNPVMISDGANDDIEILVVEGEIKTKKCRFINGYGPQESAGIDDPHKQSPNGELLLGLVVRNNLVICNATALCEGLITRTRVTVNGAEQSVIDFMLVCEEMFSYMEKMTVDEKKNFSVESYSKAGNQMKVTKTDHKMMIGKFDLKVQQKITQSRREIFKYKDVERQKRFKELTSQNTLSKRF